MNKTGIFTCPAEQTQNYIEIAILLLFFILGAPVNLHVYQLLSEKRLHTIGYLPKGFKMLQKQLNVSDLMVLFIYVPSKLCTMVTDYWRGGRILCKTVKFVQPLCFHISSYIIVLIALDRAFSQKYGTLESKAKYHYIAISMAWFLAVAFSAPQLFYYELYYPSDNPMKPLCKSKSYIELVALKLRPKTNESMERTNEIFSEMSMYAYSHVVSLFYVPFVIIITCYVWLIVKVCRSHQYELAKTKQETKTCEGFRLRSQTNKHSSSENSYRSREPKLEPIEEESENVHIVVQKPRRNTVLSTASGMKIQLKVFRLAMILVLAYLLCWVPYMIASLNVTGEFTCIMRFLHEAIVFNSVINPFLYGIKR